jgi:hypothetical protein
MTQRESYRMLKLKPQSRPAALETYESDPSKVEHSNEILTSIVVPTKIAIRREQGSNSRR